MGWNNDLSFRAGGNIAPASFVKIDTSADNQCVQAGAGDPVIGIVWPAQQKTPGLSGSDTTIAYSAGDSVMVRGMGNDAMLQLGGSVTRGDYLKSDGSGFGVTASSGDQAGAIALQSGSSGLQIRVLVVNRKA